MILGMNMMMEIWRSEGEMSEIQYEYLLILK